MNKNPYCDDNKVKNENIYMHAIKVQYKMI